MFCKNLYKIYFYIFVQVKGFCFGFIFHNNWIAGVIFHRVNLITWNFEIIIFQKCHITKESVYITKVYNGRGHITGLNFHIFIMKGHLRSDLYFFENFYFSEILCLEGKCEKFLLFSSLSKINIKRSTDY